MDAGSGVWFPGARRLLRLEDNALLLGAVTSFLAVAAVMYFRRNINWYSSIPAGGEQPPPVIQK
jgi:inner membrane protein